MDYSGIMDFGWSFIMIEMLLTGLLAFAIIHEPEVRRWEKRLMRKASRGLRRVLRVVLRPWLERSESR